MLTAVMAIAFVGCEYDDSELTGRVNDLEGRVQTLEQLCQQMNTNISAMQAIVNALQTQDAITAVTPITEGGKVIGYTITFVKGDPITIYHGQDGKDGANGKDGADGEDGYTPVIGVDQAEDGEYYWTLDGEWLTDTEGNKIPTSGADGADGADGEDGTAGNSGMPQLKIQGGYWYVSYDGGETWERLGRATGYDGQDGKDGQNGANGDAFFDDVDDSNADYVVFELTDGTTFKVPKYKAFKVEIISTSADYIQVGGNSDVNINFSVEGCNDPTVVVLSDLKTTVSTGLITVKAPAERDDLDDVETVTLMVSNGSTTVMASVDITVADAVISGGADAQTNFNNAVSSGKSSIVLGTGTYTIPTEVQGKTITIKGDKSVIIDTSNANPDTQAYNSATISFEGVTVKGVNNKDSFIGYAVYNLMTFTDCNINDMITFYGPAKFVGCTFTTSDAYAVKTWGAKEITVENCTFNTKGRGFLYYPGSNVTGETTVTFTNCTFNDSTNGTGNDKAAIEVADTYPNQNVIFNLTINSTKVNGFTTTSQNDTTYGGTNLGTNVWGNKNLIPADRLNVKIDGVDVY